jgi:hypothetical protein
MLWWKVSVISSACSDLFDLHETQGERGRDASFLLRSHGKLQIPGSGTNTTQKSTTMLSAPEKTLIALMLLRVPAIDRSQLDWTGRQRRSIVRMHTTQ